MSNIDAANALITAINFDRFNEIEECHNPNVLFTSFRGPILRSSVAVTDWHRTFLRDYADCNYTDLEYLEEGETVAVRATIEAKGYSWRPFTQRVIDVFDFAQGGVAERRLYAMLQDIALDKPATASMNNAIEFRGGSASSTKAAIDGLFGAYLSGDKETMVSFLADKATLVDSVYGIVSGASNVVDVLLSVPKPAFGSYRVTRSIAGAKDGLVEMSIDPGRPRRADWVRMVDDKILVIETYWMFREIGIKPESRGRFIKAAIMPI